MGMDSRQRFFTLMEFDSFLRAVCPRLDLNDRKYRRRAVRRRIQDRLGELSLADYEAYLQYIDANPGEAGLLPDRMRVTVSRFFRDRKAWACLARQVLPGYLDEHSERSAIRAWSAGCCGGEEAYSLVLLWLQYLADDWTGHSLTVLATDIDRPCLERAGSGRYETPSLREVSPALRERWFLLDRGGWRIKAPARDRVVFREHNVQTDDPPEDLDLVLCRYLVFTYYRGTRRLRAFENLLRGLRPGGMLMVGMKEELTPAEDERLVPVPNCRGIFYKKGIINA